MFAKDHVLFFHLFPICCFAEPVSFLIFRFSYFFMLLFCEIVVSIFSLFSHALFVCPGSFPLLFHSFPCHCLRTTDHFPSSSISHLFPLRRFHARKDPHSLCHPSLLLRARGFSFTWFCPHVQCVSDLKCEFFAFSPNEQDHLGTNSLASETIFIIIQ